MTKTMEQPATLAALAGLAALALTAACGAPDRAGEPAAAPLDPILARFKAASGGERWDAVVALADQSTIDDGGLHGESSGVEELTTGRSATHYTLGPIRGADGHDGTTSWSQAPGGEVTRGTGPRERVGAASDAWMTTRSYWFPGRRPGRIEREPDRDEGGRHFHLVRATPTGGRPMVLWFDAGTGLLDRRVVTDDGITTTTRLADYRPVDGLVLPFEIRVGTGQAKYDIALHVQRYRVNPTVAAGAFSPPRASLDDVAFAGGRHETTVPFDLVNNHIYVRAEVDGHPVRLLVDTGGANILTPAAAAALGLHSEGAMEARGAGDGSQDLGVTRARSLRLGDVTIARPVFYTIDLAPLSPVEGLELSGLVGYEVFHRFAVRIDYAARRLTLTDPRHFDPRAVAGEVLPFTWDGQVPVVAGSLDGLAGQFTVDTGSRSSLTVNAGFTATHRLAAKYRAGAQRVTGWGVGGPVRSQPVRLGDLVLGSLHVRHLAGDLFSGAKGAFADRHNAGNIGSGLLRRFTVTFDYARTRMILEPNRDFAAADDFDRSGMWINGQAAAYEVVDVIAGGAAARAGLAPGDRIVALGGQPARFEDLPRARQRLREEAAGTRLPVVYERKGAARRTTALVLADAIPAQ
ncbi:MAG TPA: pepsin/retropepsin-like aspartic protease family protein [Kofleriaceae bacterium]|nr:pepsin/retropepsin-like aspartic protease family protein [Kofleriaceae bacterium]